MERCVEITSLTTPVPESRSSTCRCWESSLLTARQAEECDNEGMTRSERLRHGKTTAALILVMAVVLALLGLVSYMRNYGDQQQSGHQVRQLLAMLIVQRTVSRGTQTDARPDEERLYGKNIVLSLVASGQLDPTDPKQLGLLFRHRVVPADIDASSYAGVTMEALRTRRFPHLTDVIGRAESIESHSNAAHQLEAGTPMIALALPSFLVVGYSSGHAVLEDRGEQLPSWLSDE